MPGTLGLTAEQVDDLLRTADRAPSPHDNRPWRFTVTPRVIELHAAVQRTRPLADPDGREQRLACGSALFTLRLALHAHRIRPIVTLMPDRDQPDLLAVVRHGGTKEPTPLQTRLLLAVPALRSDRRPFRADAVAPLERHALRRAAIDEGAWLQLVHDGPRRAEVRALVLWADRLQRGGAVRPGDGDPDLALEDEPLIAVLTSQLAGTTAEVQVGQALARVLLVATAAGLATSLLPQVVEVPRIREELRRLIGGTRLPQAALRVGYAQPVEMTPLRDDELLEPHGVAAT